MAKHQQAVGHRPILTDTRPWPMELMAADGVANTEIAERLGVAKHNADPKPRSWTASAESIIDKGGTRSGCPGASVGLITRC